MAKKKKSSKKISMSGLVLTVFGAAMLLLALVPAISLNTEILGNSTVTTTSFWQMFVDIFENGFGKDSTLVLNICTMVYLILGMVAVVLGLLGLFKILNTDKLAVLVYVLTFAALLTFMIVFLTSDLASLSLSLGGLASAKVSTLVYIPLAVSALFTGYGIYKLVK